jgi:hypothetical protein
MTASSPATEPSADRGNLARRPHFAWILQGLALSVCGGAVTVGEYLQTRDLDDIGWIAVISAIVLLTSVANWRKYRLPTELVLSSPRPVQPFDIYSVFCGSLVAFGIAIYAYPHGARTVAIWATLSGLYFVVISIVRIRRFKQGRALFETGSIRPREFDRTTSIWKLPADEALRNPRVIRLILIVGVSLTFWPDVRDLIVHSHPISWKSLDDPISLLMCAWMISESI